MDREFKGLQRKIPKGYGVGGTCLGISTGGPWSQEEWKAHINILELKAVHLAILTFTKFKIVHRIHVHMDNKVAHSKDILGHSKQIWHYLQSKKITSTAEYLPGHLNVTANWESRNFQDTSNWKLFPEIFAKICQKLVTPSIDLFASRMSHQLPAYMTWKPDPGNQATNVMYQP